MYRLLILIYVSVILAGCEKETPQPEPRTEFLKVGEYTSFHMSYVDWRTQTFPKPTYHLSHKDSMNHDDIQTYDREMITNDSTIVLNLDYYYTYVKSSPFWFDSTIRVDIDSNQRVVLNWTSDYEFEVILTNPDGTPIDSLMWPLNTSDLTLESTSLGNGQSVKRWGLENSEHHIRFSIQVWYH